MHKKLIIACMAIAAFVAFFAAPAASAATLTESASPLTVGSSFEFRSTGNISLTTSAGTVVCSTATLKAKLTQNNTTGPVKGEIPVGSAVYGGTGTSGDCTSGFLSGAPFKWTTNSKLCFELGSSTDTVKVTGCGGVVTITFTNTGVNECKYETASMSGSVSTNVTPAVVTFSEQPFIGESTNSFSCITRFTLDQTFDLYTTGGAIGLTMS